MPPKSDPRREEALRLYLDSRGKKSLQCIADELGVSKSTVASWKIRGDWEALLKPNGRKPRSQTSSANTGRKKDGYYGNTNAAGQRSDTSNFMGNHNALKHGRYEEIKYDTMSDDEKELMAVVEDDLDPVTLQIRLVQELEIRERRMLHRISALREASQSDPDGMISVSASVQQKGKGNKSISVKKTKASALAKIQEIETALTFVQRQKQAAILALHKLRQDALSNDFEQRRLSIQQQRVDLDRRRLSMIDPDAESDSLKEAKRLLEGIPSAF